MFNLLKSYLRSKKGFTLLEVIVAITILGGGLVVVMGLFSGGLKSAALSNEYSTAIYLAKLKISELEMSSNYTNSRGGFEGGEYNIYSWDLEVTPYPVEINPDSKIIPSVLKAVIRVSWNNKKVELTTIKTKL